MKHSKIVRIIKQFNSEEIQNFRLFLKSPYFKSPPYVDLLFEYLISFQPNFDGMEKALAFKKIIPEAQNYNKELFNNIMSKLLKEAEKFMAHTELQRDKTLSDQLTISFYKHKSLPNIFEKRCDDLLKKLVENQEQKYPSYLKRYQVNHLYYFYPATQKYTQNSKLIEHLQENLDRFYMSEKLKLATEISIRKKILKEEQTIYLIEEVLKYAKRQQHPIFKLYYQLYQMTSEKPDPQRFDSVHQFFLKNMDHLSSDAKARILLLLVNQANILVFSGAVEYRNAQHNLYKTGAQQKLFSLQGFMDGAIFYNITTTAAILKKFKYAKQFINQHQHLLDPKAKDDVLQLSKSFLFFHQGNFEKADHLFQSHKFSNQHYKLLANSLHLRCLFEEALKQKHFENVFIKFSATFRRFIARHKLLSEQRKTAYFNLIKAARLLMRSKDFNIFRKEKQAIKIKSLLEDRIVSKEWLIEKAKQLSTL